MGGMAALRFLLLSFFATLIFGQGITESGINYFGLFTGTLPRIINPKLTYYGGPIIPSVEVVEVIWGAPAANRTYITQLTNGLMERWYRSIVNSVYVDWLSEYKTSTQNISRGTFKGRYVITPAPTLLTSPITDLQVQNELKRQFGLPAAQRKLPLPNAAGTQGKTKTVYMIHFPNQIQVSWTLGITCATICAYHGSFVYGNKYVPYAVIPSMGGGLCPQGCGKAANLYQNTQIVASHELIESITDTRISEAIPFVLPLLISLTNKVGWYDLTSGEIADICLGQFGYIHHPTGGTLTVQKQWSNFDQLCIISRDFVLSTSSSTTVSLPRNITPVNINLIITQLGGSRQLIRLKPGVTPTGITVTFSRNNFTSGSTIMTLKANANAPVGNSIFRIQAIGKDYTKRLTFTLQLS
jgi:hypothetical protein